jgi:mono/diheme cytochrome c family protein
MKKIYTCLFLAAAVVAFSYCSSSKKAAGAAPVAKAPAKINYQANVMSIIQANCAPCHFPDKGGNKKPLDGYAAVSSQIDEILRRIQLNPTDRGFMPNRHPKLSDSTINVIRQWKADGLTEK